MLRFIAVLLISMFVIQAGWAQSSASSPPSAGAGLAKLPAWDVVSVNPAQAGTCKGSLTLSLPNGVWMFCMPLLSLIPEAYGIHLPNRILGAPDWVKDAGLFDIAASVSAEDVPRLQKSTPSDRNRMLQSLLADRFHLQAHIERRETPVHELVVANRPKLKRAIAEGLLEPPSFPKDPGRIDWVDIPVTSLLWYLYLEVGHPVVDKTGLVTKYDFNFDCTPADESTAEPCSSKSTSTLLEERFGLRLVPTKAPIDFVVIDSIQQPLSN